MQFAWIGFLKPGSETIPQDVNAQTNDFLQQPYLNIQFVGPLCVDGRRAAMLLVFEADDMAAAEALVANSPYLKAGLYERAQLYEFRNEVG